METKINEVKQPQHHDDDQENSIIESGSVLASPGEILSLDHVDQTLSAKMNLVNDLRLSR